MQPLEGWNGGNQDVEANTSQMPVVRAQMRNDAILDHGRRGGRDKEQMMVLRDRLAPFTDGC